MPVRSYDFHSSWFGREATHKIKREYRTVIKRCREITQCLLRPSGDTEELIDLIEEVSREMGDVKLIIIDTLSRTLSGGNENSPDETWALS